MKKAELLTLLMDKFPSIRKDGLEHLAMSLLPLCSTQEKAEDIVGELTAESVSEIVKEWRKSVDAENNKAIETFKKSLPSPTEPKKDEPKPAPQEPNKPVDTPSQGMTAEAIAKLVSEAVAQQMKPMQDEIARFKGKEVQTNRQSLLESELNGTPESFRSVLIESFKSRQFESDDAFNEYLNATKEKISTFKQEMADNGLKSFGGPSPKPKHDTDKVDPAVTAYIEAKKNDTGLGGKQL